VAHEDGEIVGSDRHSKDNLCKARPFDALSLFSIFFRRTQPEYHLESHGPLGTLWVGIGLGCFYIALIWLNTLLGFVLTPLFIIPTTWLMDRMSSRRATRDEAEGHVEAER